MANEDLKNKLQTRAAGGQSVAKSVKSLLSDESIKKRFEEMLGKKAAGFISSVLNVVSNNKMLSTCDPNSVVGSAAVAATLDLPINPNLGFAAIVPYNQKDGPAKAQFQMMYKGFIQLAMRTGQYKTISAAEVYEGEIKSHNRITGEIDFDLTGKHSDKIVGYVAYFKLLNGFEKYWYMTIQEVEDHGKKFSKAFNKSNSLWKTDFHSMAIKTVLKLLLSKYGILSIEMQTALTTDQAIVKNISTDDNFECDYADNGESMGEAIEVEAEIMEDEKSVQEPAPGPGPNAINPAEVDAAISGATNSDQGGNDQCPTNMPKF